MNDVLPELRDRLGEGDLTCALCDAGRARPLVLPWRVAFGPEAFAGPVRTVSAPTGELAPIDRALHDLAAGAVLLIDAGGDAAVWGGRLTERARGRGAAGVVIGGCVRDVPALRATDLPVRALGVAPHRSDASGDGAVDVPVDVGGTRVHPGEVLVADANGVVLL